MWKNRWKMKLNKIAIFMEKVWLAIALTSLVLWAYKSYVTSMYDARYFLYAAIFALIFFLVRQGVRKSFERKQKEMEEREN